MEQALIRVGDVLQIEQGTPWSEGKPVCRLSCLGEKGQDMVLELQLHTARKLFSMLNVYLKTVKG